MAFMPPTMSSFAFVSHTPGIIIAQNEVSLLYFSCIRFTVATRPTEDDEVSDLQLSTATVKQSSSGSVGTSFRSSVRAIAGRTAEVLYVHTFKAPNTYVL